MASTLCLAWGAVPLCALPWPPRGPHQPRAQVGRSPTGFLGQILASWPHLRSPVLLARCPRSHGHAALAPSCLLLFPLLQLQALHLQGLAGCCPQQAGEARQGRRETLGLQSHPCSTLLPWAGPYASVSPSVIYLPNAWGLVGAQLPWPS